MTNPQQRSKAKRKNSNLSYCQRLIQSLDRADDDNTTSSTHEVGKTDSTLHVHLASNDDTICETRKTSKGEAANLPISGPDREQTRVAFLALPAEVRQKILFNTLNDDEISWLELAPQAQSFKQVCRTFKADMEWVAREWQVRKAELTKCRQTEQGIFDFYITDLMAPLKSHAKVLKDRTRLSSKGIVHAGRSPNRRKGGDKRKADMKLARADFTYPSHQDIYGNRWTERRWGPQSMDERREAANWRERRMAGRAAFDKEHKWMLTYYREYTRKMEHR